MVEDAPEAKAKTVRRVKSAKSEDTEAIATIESAGV